MVLASPLRDCKVSPELVRELRVRRYQIIQVASAQVESTTAYAF